MYAVIKTGGKQYRVQPGDTIVVEKLEGDAGAELTLGSVLMLGGDNGVTLGAPLIEGATVAATMQWGPLGIKEVLAGFGDSTAWLIAAAFIIADGFVITGLGRRIALVFLSRFGGTALGLAYGLG